MLFALANLWPEFYTLIPAGFISGVCGSTLWTAHAQYTTLLARDLSLATDKPSEEMVNNLFGIFFAIFQVNQIFGNIISSIVIGDGFPSFTEIGNQNASEIESIRDKCGLNQVNEPSSCEAGAINDQTLYLLMGEFDLYFMSKRKSIIDGQWVGHVSVTCRNPENQNAWTHCLLKKLTAESDGEI